MASFHSYGLLDSLIKPLKEQKISISGGKVSAAASASILPMYKLARHELFRIRKNRESMKLIRSQLSECF